MYKILLVGDDIDIIEMMKEYLTLKGYEVWSALDGEEALNKIKYSLDLII